MEKQQGGSVTLQQGGQKIDLNTASKDQLMNVMGVSEKNAQQIVNFRDEHGGFSSIDQLKDVEGLSDSLTDEFRAALNVGSPLGGSPLGKSGEKGGGKR